MTAASYAVLLIEDNELDARTMIKGLSTNADAEFIVTRADDLASATELLERSAYDCVLLDLSLPDSEGLASLGWLTATFPDCPIVVLTGLDDPATAFAAVQQGAQDYLSKQSARPETISRSIRYAVARMQSELALRSATDQLTLFHDRERIARDLHDTVIQQLFATGIGLQSVMASITDHEARSRVEVAVQDIDAAIHQLREAIFGLHTMPLGISLSQVIAAVAAEKEEALGFMPVVEVGPMPEDLPEFIRHEAIQVVNEGLSNVIKHARASATKVSLEIEDEMLVVSVTDNGVGSAAETRSAQRTAAGEATEAGLTGHGLKNMRQRAAELDGRFHTGPGPGGGTRIEWQVPIRPDHVDR
ncbi:MAG: response regulator [Acidimicrobiales bacterium]